MLNMGLRAWVEQGRLLGCTRAEAPEGHPQFVVAPDERHQKALVREHDGHRARFAAAASGPAQAESWICSSPDQRAG